MRKNKRVIAQFSFHDRTGISSYLEKMALRGWMLDKITRYIWHFRRIEPRRIHFAISYFAKTSTFEPEAPEALVRFREFCQHSGWKFCAEAAQMQIFYNEADNPIPIETDALLEIESIHKGMKKQQLPANIALSGIALLYTLLMCFGLARNPLGLLKMNVIIFFFLTCVLTLLLMAVELGGYFLWRTRAIKAARRDGSFLPTRGIRVFAWVFVCIILAAFVLLILTDLSSYESVVSIISLVCFALLRLIIGVAGSIMKRMELDAKTNRNRTLALAIILSFIMVLSVNGLRTRMADYGLFGKYKAAYVLAPEEEYEYEIFNHTLYHTLYHHALPLHAEDIYDTDIGFNGPVYSNYRQHQESIAMSFDRCHATLRRDIVGTELPDLYYTVIDVKLGFLTELIFQDALDEKDHAIFEGRYEYRPIDAGIWSADEAYQEFGTDYVGGSKKPKDNYLIRWGDRIVLLNLKVSPTEEQIAIIVEKLGT